MNALFVCVRNAGRSQIAEALFARAAGGRHRARSAGSEPAAEVHPEAIAVLADLGIDISARQPRRLARADVEWADVVVTMGCGDACPIVPAVRYVEWDLPDPAGRPLSEVRDIRDDIESRVRELVASLDRETR